jgi:NTE family protein
VNEITFNSALLSEMRAIAFVQKLLDEGWIKDEFRDRLKYVRLHSLQADDWLSDLSVASKTISDWGFLTMLRDRGRNAGSAWLEENLTSVGKRTSTDIRGRYLKH